MSSDQVVSRQPSTVREIIPPKAKSALAVNPSTSRRLALCASLIVCGGSPARADETSQPPQGVEEQSLGEALSYGAPIDPLSKGKLEVKITPTYVSGPTGNSNNSSFATNVHGGGGSGGVTYGFSDHWGLAVIGAGNSIRGTSALNPLLPGGNYFPGFPNCGPSGCPSVVANENGQGLMAAANVIFDPFSGNGFRLPIFAGLSYTGITETVDNPTLGIKRTGYLHSAGLFGGLSPSIPVWKFRFTPFFLVSDALEKSTTAMISYNSQTGAKTSEIDFTNSSNYSKVFALGLSIAFTPLHLSFTYKPDIFGPPTYSVTYSHNFTMGSPD